MKKRLLLLLACIMFVCCLPLAVQAAVIPKNGIAGNGTGGITIDITKQPYTTFGANSDLRTVMYDNDGCGWFASARVKQLTGKGNTIYNGVGWWNNGSSLGFTRGSEPKAPALICYQTRSDRSAHVAVLEKFVDANTVIISEGGNGDYPNNGYCVIRKTTLANVKAGTGGFGTLQGYVYLPGAQAYAANVDLGTRFYAHISRLSNGKLLRSTAKSYETGTWGTVKQYAKENLAKEEWYFERQSDGSYLITSRYNGSVIDVAGAKTANGTDIQVVKKSGNKAQYWYIRKNGAGYYLVSKLNTSRAIDVTDGSNNNGANAQLYVTDNTTAQRFTINKITETVPTGLTLKALTILLQGKSETLTPVFTPSNAAANRKGIVWSSSAPDIAVVDSTGKVTAKKTGIAVITATSKYNDKYKASCTVTVLLNPAKIFSLDTDMAPQSIAVEQEIHNMQDDAESELSQFSILRLSAKKIGKKAVTLSWTKVPEAESYVIFGNACGKKKAYEKIKTVSSNKLSLQVKKLADGAKLKKGTYYKFIVMAVGKDKTGTEKALAASKSVHIITAGSKKYSNFTGVKITSKKQLTLKVGKTSKIKAKQVKASGRKVKQHRKICYESNNPSAATVSKKGKIRAIAAGKATIYVYSQNGLYAKVKVTVK